MIDPYLWQPEPLGPMKINKGSGLVFPPGTLTPGKCLNLPDGRVEMQFTFEPAGVDSGYADLTDGPAENYTQADVSVTHTGTWPELVEKPADTRGWWARRVRPWLPALLVFVAGPMASCFLEGPWWAGLPVGLVCVWGVVAAIPEEAAADGEDRDN